MPISDSGFMLRSLEFLATFFVIFVGLCALAIVVVYILDVTQTKQAIRRNYPVIGHFRYFFEEIGKFFLRCTRTQRTTPLPRQDRDRERTIDFIDRPVCRARGSFQAESQRPAGRFCK